MTTLSSTSRSSIALNLRRSRYLASLLVAVIATGCAGDVAAPRPIDGSTTFWALTLDHHAITLSTVAPYDTIRLVATPRASDGHALSGLADVRFASGDLARVQVSVDGLVQAVSVGSSIPVVVTLRANNVTHTDTAYITVTGDSPPPVLDTFSIHPEAPDSAKVAMNSPGKMLSLRATDSAGNPISDLAVDFQSSDTSIAIVDRALGLVTGIRPGRVTIVASATAYGVTRTDTLPFTIGLPLSAFVFVEPGTLAYSTTSTAFAASGVTIAKGGTVLWHWYFGIPSTDVTFDDPTNVAQSTGGFGADGAAGNIPAPIDCRIVDGAYHFMDCNHARTFPVAGTYTYHSTATGATGRVVVVDEHASAP
jgi:hypothetical protein